MQTTSSNRFDFLNKRSRLAVTALAALTLFGGAFVGQAKAQGYTHGLVGGYEATIKDSGSIYGNDHLLVDGPRGEEYISVTCAPYDWKSEGPNTAKFVEHIASEWCASAFE